MSWNDGVERKKFERNWSKDEKAYRGAGMSEEQILSIRELKEEQYRSERRYQMHTQPLIASDFGDDDDDEQEDKSVLLNKFQDELTVTFEYHSNSRFGWIEEIENEKLARYLLSLCEIDKEILTLLAFEERSQKEIAEITGIPYRTVKYKINRLRNNMKNLI